MMEEININPGRCKEMIRLIGLKGCAHFSIITTNCGLTGTAQKWTTQGGSKGES